MPSPAEAVQPSEEHNHCAPTATRIFGLPYWSRHANVNRLDEAAGWTDGRRERTGRAPTCTCRQR